MTTAMTYVDDANLVRRALQGEQRAVGEMYDRYADAIYSFCRSRLRNDADAADATQETFIRAATKLEQLREPEKLRSWLYAIARNQIITTGKQSVRFAGDDEMELVVAPESEPDIDLLRVEAANQLWDAADGLSPRDHEVLELHLRHGLVGQSLADALGVTESHANVLLSRMRDRIGTSLGSLLVAREGQVSCFELGLLLAGWDGRFTLDIRSKVTRHVKACDICEETRTRVLASGVSFGVLPIIPAPSGIRVGTIEKMAESLGIKSAGSSASTAQNSSLRFADVAASSPIDVDGWEWQPNGFPGAVATAARRGTILLSAAAVFVLLVVVGGLAALVFNEPAEVETAASIQVAGAVQTTEPAAPAALSSSSEALSTTAAPSSSAAAESSSTTEIAADQASTTQAGALITSPPTSAQTTTAPPTTIPPTTTPPTTVAPTTVTTTTQATTTAAPTTQPTTTSSTSTSTTSTTTSTTSTTTEAPPPVNEPPVFTRAAASAALVEVKQGARCQGESVTVIAVVADPDGTVDSVVVTWIPGNGQIETTTLQPALGAGPDTFAGSIGPWFETGRQSSSVTATDDDGESTTTRITVTVTGCPAG